MIHHDATVLNDFDSGFCERFGGGIVTNSRLQPYCLRHLSLNIFKMKGLPEIGENVHEINFDRSVNEPAKTVARVSALLLGAGLLSRNYMKADAL
jgi:hypothetical protein